MGPQQFDTIIADTILAQANMLDGNKLCQMGPQRFDTIVAKYTGAEVNMLAGMEVC